MRVPKGFYIIFQPKHRTPSVLDLNERGLFKVRPFVTGSWTYRVIADKMLQVKLQYICLLEKETTDPETNQRYSYTVDDRLIDLDGNLAVKPEDLAAAVPERSISEKILADLEDFKSAYIPLDEHKKIDAQGLKNKLKASIADRKKILRKELMRKNDTWVNAAMPRLIQDFRRTFYLEIGDRLHEHYHQLDGRDNEEKLIKKINLFNRVYENNGQDLMRKPDGGIWTDEDEIWECWVGFAGGEEEAERICRTMNAVLRPLAEEMSV